MALSKYFTNDNIKNSAKIDTLIEVVLEKENISKTYFDKMYEQNLIKEHLNFNKRVGSDSVFNNSKEKREEILNQSLTEIFNRLSEEEKEEIIKRYL